MKVPAAILLATCLLAACAETAPMPDDVTISGDGAVRIASIDGVRTRGFVERVLLGPYPDSVSVTPGRHTLLVTTRLGDAISTQTLELTASRGHSYLIRSTVTGYHFTFSIDDQNSTGKSF